MRGWFGIGRAPSEPLAARNCAELGENRTAPTGPRRPTLLRFPRDSAAREAEMARSARRAIDYEDEGSPGSMLARFLVWAGLAAAALGSAALAAQTRTGTERLVSLLGLPAPAGGAGKSAAPASVVIRPSDAEIESRRLAEAVRLLTADRDRVLARLETLEHSLEVTGSIPRGPPASGAPDGPVVPPNWSLVPSSIPLAAGLPPAAGLTPPVVPTAPGAGFPAAGAPTTTTHGDVHAASGRTPQHG